MSASLSLVIEIVTVVEEAAEAGQPLDIDAEAQRLLRAHPETEISVEEIAALIRQQQQTLTLQARSEGDRD